MKAWRSVIGWGLMALVAVLVVAAVGHSPGPVRDAGEISGLMLFGMAGIIGKPFTALRLQDVQRMGSPGSGGDVENVWWQFFDSQTYVDNTTTSLTFFNQQNADRTLTNMPVGGVLAFPQTLRIHNVCLDVLSAIPVTTSATLTGALDDLSLLIFSSGARPTWQLNIGGKLYGPFSLTTLGGTGGPNGFGFSSDGAEIIQWARNDPHVGWDFCGQLVILPMVDFNVQLNWAAAANLTADKILRVSLCGPLTRRVG